MKSDHMKHMYNSLVTFGTFIVIAYIIIVAFSAFKRRDKSQDYAIGYKDGYKQAMVDKKEMQPLSNIIV